MADDAAFQADADVLTAAAQGRLKSLIERIERLEEDKTAVMADLKEVYSEAKGEGFDTKIIRKVVRLRKQDTASARRRKPWSTSTCRRSGACEAKASRRPEGGRQGGRQARCAPGPF